ncbi:MAG: oligosaccharide flippase family protein [Candidatus Eisenbacteria bacterium]
MSGTRRNIAANVAGRVWGVASFYLFVPIYLRLLGPEAYGVVGFFAVMVGVLAIADLGLTSTLSREMARLGSLEGGAVERRDLMRTLEFLYLGLALAVGASMVLLAPAIADGWLQEQTLPRAELIEALRLMGVVLALLLPANFYFGGLLGLERLVEANLLVFGWGLLRSGGAALALWLVSPSLRVFFVTVTVAGLIYLIAARIACWRAVGSSAGTRFRGALLARTWRYSAGIAALSALSAGLSQLDKVVVSRMLPLDTFAHYSLASTLAQVPVIVAAAIATALFPRLTALVAADSAVELRRLYHSGCQLVAVVALPLGLTLAAYAGEVLRFWTHSPATAGTAAAAGSLLLLGSTALALQLVPFQLALAFGWVGLNLRLATVSLLVVIPALWWLVARLGLVGAGWVWLGLNVLTTPVMIVWLHRRVLPGATREWFVSDLGRPLIATLAVLAPARLLVPVPAEPLAAFAMALAVGGVALAAAAWAAPAGRRWLRLRRLETTP